MGYCTFEVASKSVLNLYMTHIHVKMITATCRSIAVGYKILSIVQTFTTPGFTYITKLSISPSLLSHTTYSEHQKHVNDYSNILRGQISI